MSVLEELRNRAQNKCEICANPNNLRELIVAPRDGSSADDCVLTCSTCRPHIEGAPIEQDEHWYCMRESAWSHIPAVQVVCGRLLKRLANKPWAVDLREQLYFPPEVESWIEAGQPTFNDEVVTKDSNGTRLQNGDDVTLIKDLDVKGAGFTAKRGTLVRGIRLIDDPDNIEGKVNKIELVLKTKFLKKA